MSDAPLSTDDRAVHTPGPWKEHAPNIDGEVDETYRQITAGVGFFPSDDEPGVGFKLTGFIRPADARLIAAAPDLLAALNAVVAISDRKHDAWDAAHLAIAKAMGTDPCEECNKRPITGDDALCDGCRHNRAEAAYDRSMEEPTFRGGEYAASVAAEQARIQRELK